MTTRRRIPRREFLAASGAVLAGAAIAGSVEAAPPAPPGPPPQAQAVLAALPASPPGRPGPPPRPNATAKIGTSPTYITGARGQNLYNPYFRPQGQPSTTPLPTPQAVSGTQVDQGAGP